jgi:hypothetical protein
MGQPPLEFCPISKPYEKLRWKLHRPWHKSVGSTGVLLNHRPNEPNDPVPAEAN